jgi:hypothetical protein
MNYPFKEKVAIHCPTPKYSEQVQEVLFELGCKWTGNGSTCVKLTYKSWLFVKDGEITWLDYNYNNVKEVDLYVNLTQVEPLPVHLQPNSNKTSCTCSEYFGVGQ